MKPLAATGRSFGLPALVLALATAIGLGVGFGVSITNLQSALETTRNDLALSQARAAQQEAIVAEIILNSTEPAPVLNVLQTGVYDLFIDASDGNPVGFELEYRVVEIQSSTRNFVVLELDLPTTPTTLVPVLFPSYELAYYIYMVNFNPEPLLPGFDSTPYLFFTKQNRERFVVSGGCLATAECLLAGEDPNFNLVPSLVRTFWDPFSNEFYLFGPPSVLEGKQLSFTGPLVIPLTSF